MWKFLKDELPEIDKKIALYNKNTNDIYYGYLSTTCYLSINKEPIDMSIPEVSNHLIYFIRIPVPGKFSIFDDFAKKISEITKYFTHWCYLPEIESED